MFAEFFFIGAPLNMPTCTASFSLDLQNVASDVTLASVLLVHWRTLMMSFSYAFFHAQIIADM